MAQRSAKLAVVSGETLLMAVGPYERHRSCGEHSSVELCHLVAVVTQEALVSLFA